LYLYEHKIFQHLNNFANNNKPFFMYIAWQATHFPFEQGPNDNFYIGTKSRDAVESMIERTDLMFLHLIQHLKNLNIWDNTLIIFTNDNGGISGSNDNSPFRGEKGSLFEGGVHTWAFVGGGYLNYQRRGSIITEQFMHAIDWYPTLLEAANIPISNNKQLDGISMWPLIQYGQINDNMNNRNIITNVDSRDCTLNVCGSLIYHNQWKLIYSTNHVSPNSWDRSFPLDSNNSLPWNCGMAPNSTDDSMNQICASNPCLFNLLDDPCEYEDVNDNYPQLTQFLIYQLQLAYNESVESNAVNECTDSSCNPAMFNNTWTPWLDVLNNDNSVSTTINNTA